VELPLPDLLKSKLGRKEDHETLEKKSEYKNENN